MDRIRHNLRIRSGRKKQTKDTIDNAAVQDASVPETYHGPSLAARKSSPTLRFHDSSAISALPVPVADEDRHLGPAFRLHTTSPLPSLPHDSEKGDVQALATPTLRRTRPAEQQRPSPQQRLSSLDGTSSDDRNYDLGPPPLNAPSTSMEGLSDMLFSKNHLMTILSEPRLISHFTAFLNTYRPALCPILVRWLQMSKAMKAIDYANALAVGLAPFDGEKATHLPHAAAVLDGRFESKSNRALESLLGEALPAFLCYNIIKISSELLYKDITGTQLPMLRDLKVMGLSEVFVITDPSLPDNPIIYASDEFHRLTGYGRDFVIGRNCRFLQGPKTRLQSVARLSQAIRDQQEISEVFLNYKRDGTPFMNCLNMAPLLDKKGRVRYFIGAQTDVSGLVEEGRGLDSFERYLATERLRSSVTNEDADNHISESKRGSSKADKDNALQCLRELSEKFDLEEAALVRNNSRSNSLTKEADGSMSTFRKPQSGTSNQPANQRRVLIDETLGRSSSDEDVIDLPSETNGGFSTLSHSTASGKLPGIYQSYFLVRPAPSLRIIFVSPSLRHLGSELLQSLFLSHISTPDSTLAGLEEAFNVGVPVTTKVSWRTSTAENHGDFDRYNSRGQTRWLSATPMFGSDDRVGVWMIIMIDRHGYGGVKASRDQSTDGRTRASQFDMPHINGNISHSRHNHPSDSSRPGTSNSSRIERQPSLREKTRATGSAAAATTTNTNASSSSPPTSYKHSLRSEHKPKDLRTLSSPARGPVSRYNSDTLHNISKPPSHPLPQQPPFPTSSSRTLSPTPHIPSKSTSYHSRPPHTSNATRTHQKHGSTTAGMTSDDNEGDEGEITMLARAVAGETIKAPKPRRVVISHRADDTTGGEDGGLGSEEEEGGFLK